LLFRAKLLFIAARHTTPLQPAPCELARSPPRELVHAIFPTSQTWALSLPPRGRRIEGPQTLPERVSLAERVGVLGAVSAT